MSETAVEKENGTMKGHTHKIEAAAEATFEAGARIMRERLASEGPEAYFADATDPLHAAFAAKAVVHSGMNGMPLAGESARAVLESLIDTPRAGKSTAYIHVPFCETRCLYCMFYQNPFRAGDSRVYARRLIRELALWSDRAAQRSAPVHAVYFGGGTPTALEPEDLRDVLRAVRTYLPLANDCEITLEGRIHNFTDAKMQAAVEGGVNRFSLGVQTFDDAVRQSMMRVDGRDAILSRLEKLASFDEAAVVIDLIYGFPGQTMQVWEEDLRIASELNVDGVDCYQLNVFEKSPLAKYIANGKLPAAATTAQKADMFARSVEVLSAAQWLRISNNHWSRTTRERNVYNALGKGPCDCLAFGCGAGGRLHGHSYMLERRLADWNAAVDAGLKPVGMVMRPGPNWHLLRTVSSDIESGAINLTRIGRAFGIDLDALTRGVTEQWIEAGLLTRSGDWLVQTVAGQYWHVTLSQLLLDWIGRRLAPQNCGMTIDVGSLQQATVSSVMPSASKARCSAHAA